MRNGNRSLFSIFENMIDIMINMLAFIGGYVIAFAIIGEPTVLITDGSVQVLVFFAVLASSLIYQILNLNRPMPIINEHYPIGNIIVANIIYFSMAIVSVALFVRGGKMEFMILWMVFTAVISTTMLLFKKSIVISAVRFLRRRRYNIKKMIIVGDNADTARAFVKQVVGDRNSGIMLLGGVGRKMGGDTGCEKLGDFEDLESVLDTHRPDYVVFAVDYYNKAKLIQLVNMCDDRCIKVYFLPVIYGFFKSPKQIEHVGSLPIINIHSTPLDSRPNAAIKRIIDVIGALALIILSSPIMIITAIGVKLSSPGPVFFKQVRIGKMGKKFKMYKFRSMVVNKEAKTRWSKQGDERKTRFGAFIRSTAIDELPQLFNVLGGSMSLVGPRPEIPHFVEQFKNEIPLYMVKHYVKPGMTGLAQIKGLRGNTSVEDRILEDIAYIENWSLMLDIYILLKTPFKAFNKNEKFTLPDVDDEENEGGSATPCHENSSETATPCHENGENNVPVTESEAEMAPAETTDVPTVSEPDVRSDEVSE